MDDAEQARAYADADFADVNQAFVDRFRERFGDFTHGRVIDLGCGPADIPLRLARALQNVDILAVDGAPAMLRIAGERVAAAASPRRVHPIAARVPRLPLRDGELDAAISNSLLHHLADPAPFWREIRRITRAGAPVLVMDLFRPASRAAASQIVENAAADESPILRRDFYNSLLAAFTAREVRAQLDASGLAAWSCDVVSERHWLVAGRNPGR